MNHTKTDRGFTLIELMIVVAIIGILANVALPAYTRYIASTQVSRTYVEISAYRAGVETYLLNGNTAALAADAASALDYQDSDINSVAFGTFANPAASTITATLDGNASVGIKGTVIALQRSAGGDWSCTITGAGADWSNKMKPASCS